MVPHRWIPFAAPQDFFPMIPPMPTSNGFNHGFKVGRNGFRASTVHDMFKEPTLGKPNLGGSWASRLFFGVCSWCSGWVSVFNPLEVNETCSRGSQKGEMGSFLDRVLPQAVPKLNSQQGIRKQPTLLFLCSFSLSLWLFRWARCLSSQ